MSVFKSYFSKNNTIISETYSNTAKNPVTEIFYGGSFSRFLLQVDLSELIGRISEGYINRGRIQKHVLKLTNTINPDESSFFNGETTVGFKRATSFDLVAYKLTEQWDEGIGHDYTNTSSNFVGQNTYSENPSNWFYKDTVSQWDVVGSKDDSLVISTQHFDSGAENLEIDITSYVNNILDGNETNYGIGICFDLPYESIDTAGSYQSIGFYSKYTQTFFEPFLETTFNDHFIDNRNDFYEGTTRNLILYVNQGNEPTNLDVNPSVDIYDGDELIMSDIGTTHITKGVYQATFMIGSQSCKAPKILSDHWKGLVIGGYEIPVNTQEFTLRPSSEFFNIGTDELVPNEYGFSFMGIQRDEKISRGDIRKVYVEVKVPFMYEPSVQIDNLKYMVYVKEGSTSVGVIEWTDISRSFNSNFFLLDTSMLIPNKEYYLDLQLKTNREINTVKKGISFYIINEK